MKIGDRVRIIGIPPDLPSDDEFKTPDVLRRCLGRVFAVADIRQVEGLCHPMIGLDIGEVLEKQSCEETIYVEPEYLELVKG
jgi:hypothetical protein